MKAKTKSVRGRPLKGEEPMDKFFALYLTKRQHKKLRQASFKHGLSAAEIVRRGIDLWIKGPRK